MAITFPASSASPYTDANGTVWVWNGTAWGRRASTVAALAGSVWEAGTAYASGDTVVNRWGELVVANSAHTSGATYDATKWYTPGSPDGGTVIDFTRLADGEVADVVRPTHGQLFGCLNAESAEVAGGRFKGKAAGPNAYYLQVAVNATETIRHAWATIEVSDEPASNIGFLILLTDNDWFNGVGTNIAAVHAQIFANISGVTTYGSINAGPYAVPGSPITSGGQVSLPYSLVGRTFRYDVIVDPMNGEVRYYIDGVLVVNYTDPALVGYFSRFAIIESSGPTFKVLNFGASPMPPIDAPDQVQNRDDTYIADTALTSTYRKLQSFRVKYGRSGKVLVMWSPYINSTSGLVEMGLGNFTADTVFSSPAHKSEMVEGAFTGRVPFMEVRSGTPGTTEYLSIYGKTTGTAAVGSSGQGGTGATWMPVSNYSTYGAV